jgi:hypothetical protein
MSTFVTHARRSVRFSFLTLTLLTLALVALLMLERTGSSSPVITKLTPADSSSSSHGKGQGNPPGHCTDGHGHDAEHNKHCQMSEG